MPLFLRKLILVFVMLWLPLQGFAATNMSICQHQEQTVQQVQHAMMHAAHDGGHTHPGIDQHPAKSDLSCDNCAMCHMCSAMGIPAVAAAFNIKSTSPVVISTSTGFSLVFPELPQRPPLVRAV